MSVTALKPALVLMPRSPRMVPRETEGTPNVRSPLVLVTPSSVRMVSTGMVRDGGVMLVLSDRPSSLRI